MGALVEIAEVRLADLGACELRGGFLDQPRAGAVLDARTVDVLGWALGDRRRAVAAELSIDGEPLARVPLRAPRPDLAAAFPDRKEACRAGFRTTLDLMGSSARFELQVSIVLKGGARQQLASICGQRRWRREHSPAYAELASVVISCCGHARQDQPLERAKRRDSSAQLEAAKRHDLISCLQAAIESVLAQSYPHVEILVVHNGRADVASIATHYRGVRCIRQRQGGAAEARNAGIRSTNGDFLVFLDAESRLPPDAIERGVSALQEHPQCAAAIGAGVAVPAIYRRSLFEHVRGFDPASSGTLDFAFDLAIAPELIPFCSYETSVTGNHEHGCDMSSTSEQEQR